MIARIALAVVAATLASSLASSLAWAAGEAPQLRSEITVSDEVVRIGDLVTGAGVLADVPVFRAPDPGHVGNVPVSRVLGELRRHGLSDVEIGSVTAISVTRLSRRISPKEIEAQIAAALAGHAGLGNASRLAVTFDRDVRPLDLDVNAGELRVLRAVYSPASLRFDVVFEAPSGALSRRAPLHYTGTLAETVDVAVLTRGVTRGDVIRESDIVIERRPRASVAAGMLERAEQVVGLSPRRDLSAQQPLRAADLMKPELVHQNDSVLVTYQTPGITLTLRAQALSSGAKGDVINVVNIQSKRTMQGIIVGPNRVVVESMAPQIVASQPSSETPSASSSQPRTE